VAPVADPPVHWDRETNVRWKTPIPGEGSASPIVWQNQVYVVSAVPTERRAEVKGEPRPDARTEAPSNYYQFIVMCLDRQTGRVVWQQVATEEVPHEGRHKTNSYASGSPTTDGNRLYVSFGSRGIFCYSMDGKPVWQRDLGDMRTRLGWGEAVTPVIHGDTLVVNWDQEEDSFIVALDASTGQTRWQADRDEATTWNTPLVVTHAGRTHVVVNGTNRVRSYDLATGEVIWECGGQTVNPIPSPVAVNGIVYCVSGYRGSAAFAIPLDSSGDITGSDKILWHHKDSTPYVPSPIVYDGRIYFTRVNTGVVSCLDAMDGQAIFGPERLPGIENVYASPVAAADRIYFVSREGTTTVLKSGAELNVLATNALDEPVDASPALVGNQILIRGAKHLYCIEDRGAVPESVGGK
jgi:outer membrane protein assembly factor BamB